MSERVRRARDGSAQLDAGRTAARSFVEIVPDDVDGAEVAVEGTYFDDEPGVVECHVRGGSHAHVVLSLSPEGADDLARRLAEAATFATEGQR